MVWRRDAQPMGAGRRSTRLQRIVSRTSISNFGRPGWLFDRDRDARFDRLAFIALRRNRITADVWSRESLRCYGPELDDGQDRADLSRRRRLRGGARCDL